MAFYHGVSTAQLPTSIMPARQIDSALTVVIGCAPIHRLAEGERKAALPGSILRIASLAEAGQQLGMQSSDDFTRWGISEAIYSHMVLYGVAPILCINLFDPAIHKSAVANEIVSFTAGRARLANVDIVGAVKLTGEDGEAAYAEGVDYVVDIISGTVTLTDESTISLNATVKASYDYAAPEMVTSSEAIGGYDIRTGKTTGISLIDEVFTRYRSVPAIAIVPGFGENPSVAAILAAKMGSINGIFRGIAIVDIPSDGENAVKLYANVAEYKTKNNLVSEDLYVCWPKVLFDGRIMHLSVHAASLMGRTDGDNKEIPYVSPSNETLQAQGIVIDGEEAWLNLEAANTLNENGITTALNFVGGWKLWGNRTACYPDVTDPKDTFITHRRMMAWYGNRLILTWWQKVDNPIGRRLIETILNSERININAWTAQGVLLGGKISYREADNSLTDLMDGMIAFHVALGLQGPAERIHFDLEYDPNYLSLLFS